MKTRGRAERSKRPPARRSSRGWLALFLLPLLGGCEDITVEILPVQTITVMPSSAQIVTGEELELSLELRGAGGELLGGREVEWISDAPAIVEVTSPGMIRGVGPGETLVRARSEGVEGAVEVVVEESPSIALDSMNFTFSAEAGSGGVAEVSVAIWNAGGGTLSGLDAVVGSGEDPSEPEWLEVELSALVAPSQLRLRADPSELEVGVYSRGIELRSSVADNSPVTLSVTFEVREPPPRIALSPGSVSLAANAGSREPASQGVRVTNAGGGALSGLSVEVEPLDGAPSGWLTASLEGSSAPTDLLLEAFATDLSPGVYRARVRVSAPDAVPDHAEVDVTFNVGSSVRDGIPPRHPGPAGSGGP